MQERQGKSVPLSFLYSLKNWGLEHLNSFSTLCSSGIYIPLTNTDWASIIPKWVPHTENIAKYDLVLIFLFIAPYWICLSVFVLYLLPDYQFPQGKVSGKHYSSQSQPECLPREHTEETEACGLDLPNLGWNIRAQGSSCRSTQRSVSDQLGSHLQCLLGI